MTAFVRAWRWTSVVEAANPSGIWALGAVGGGGILERDGWHVGEAVRPGGRDGWVRRDTHQPPQHQAVGGVRERFLHYSAHTHATGAPVHAGATYIYLSPLYLWCF